MGDWERYTWNGVKEGFAGHALGYLFFVLQRFNMFLIKDMVILFESKLAFFFVSYRFLVSRTIVQRRQFRPCQASVKSRVGRRFGLSVYQLLDDITATFAWRYCYYLVFYTTDRRLNTPLPNDSSDRCVIRLAL